MGQGESTPRFLKTEAEARAWGFTEQQIHDYKVEHGWASAEEIAAFSGGAAAAKNDAATAFSAPLEQKGGEEAEPVEDDAVIIGRKIIAEMRMHHMTLTSVFANFDDNNDSTVTLDEMAKGFREVGGGVAGLQLTDMEAKAIFERFDADGSGGADVKELRTWFENLESMSQRGQLVISKADAYKGFYTVPFYNFDAKTAELKERRARREELDRVRAQAKADKKAKRAARGKKLQQGRFRI